MGTKFDDFLEKVAGVAATVFALSIAIAIVAGLFVSLPGCPIKPAEKIVYKPVPVTRTCKLPELGELPKVKMIPGPNGARCLDLENRKRLAERLSRLRQWVEQVKARCGSPRAATSEGDVPSALESFDMPGTGERGIAADGGGN